MAKKKENRKKIDFGYNLREYWSILRNYKVLLFGLLFFVFLIELGHIVSKFLFKIIIDEGTLFASGELGYQEFVFILMIVVGVYLFSNLIQIISVWLRSHFLSIMETNMMQDLKTKYFGHILGLDHNFHTSHKTGSLISRLIRGSSAIERVTDVIAFNFTPLIIQLTLVAFSLLFFSVASAITVAIVAVSFITFSYFIQRAQQASRLETIRAEDREKANVSDVFMNIDSVKYFGKSGLIRNRFKSLTNISKIAHLKNWGYFRWMISGQILIVVIGTYFLLYFPLMKFLAGEITLGTIVFIYTIYGNLMGPMWGFVHGMQAFYRSMADFQDLFEYGKIEKDIKDKPGSKNMKILHGDIEFKDIDFRYSNRKIFNKFNLKVPKNKKVALVGHSGCGKSTLVNLLYRLYDVESGAILVDGKDIRDFKQESVRSEMAIVPQEAVLFDDTIWNNIKFSNPGASKDEVRKAIRFAQLDKIIKEMPKQENTIVGERGVKLSGGEKQRVSIARALLANKKILVLDEATSALDSETEHEIQKDLARLMEGRTSIIIAHRLSTIMHADKIIVMKRGKIVQSGTHRQLINQHGEYKKLWNLQKGGYIK
jgi:ATP-binding cassette, subfamily B, heavy metal transporter